MGRVVGGGSCSIFFLEGEDGIAMALMMSQSSGAESFRWRSNDSSLVTAWVVEGRERR